MSSKVTAHGHGTFSLELDGSKIVVDPYFAGKNPAAVIDVSEVEADFILLTHGHGDHVADAVPLATATGALVIANPEITAWIEGQGYENTKTISIGQDLDLPFGRLRMTKAEHGSRLPDGSDGGEAGGYIIFTPGITIYFAGDTDLFPEMEQIGDAGLDLAIIPSGGKYTMDPDRAFSALEVLHPKVVIPCHVNTFPQIAQDMDAWAERVESQMPVRVVLLASEESFEF